ncbi:hypothetical protein ACWM35_24290, partial [Neobacillus sp. K501]
GRASEKISVSPFTRKSMWTGIREDICFPFHQKKHVDGHQRRYLFLLSPEKACGRASEKIFVPLSPEKSMWTGIREDICFPFHQKSMCTGISGRV